MMAKKVSNPVPAGLQTVTPNLYFNGNCKDAIEYYKKAFNAQLQGKVYYSPDGKTVWHSMLKIGDANIMCSDVMEGATDKGPKGSTTVSLMMYVPDCDAWIKQAEDAGGKVEMEAEDMFWGDRMGSIRDPFGHYWSIASGKWEYTPEEMQEKQDEFLAKAAK
jgi:PhnB protein